MSKINGLSVLLIDNCSFIRERICRILQLQSNDFFVIGEAEDGEAAVEMVIDGEWDLVLLDFNLTKMNGLEVLTAIKVVKPKLPVIMLSGYPESMFSHWAISKGAAAYLEKTNIDRLTEVMQEVLMASELSF